MRPEAKTGEQHPARRRGKAPLLAEVARQAGVSIATASRALNPDSTHPVSAATRARVVAAAAELRFRPNALARGLKSRRSRTIGLLVHDIRDPYFNECARGAADAAEQAGFLTIICSTDRDPRTELDYVAMLTDNRVAGMLFVGGGLEDAEYRRQIRRRVAAVRDYGGVVIALGPRGERWPAEVPDNRGGARAATEHLLALGHRRIAFVDGPQGLTTSGERLAGYRDALQSAEVAFDADLVAPGGFTAEGGAAALADLLDRRAGITAVLAANDMMALGCWQELRRRGLRIPADVSLVGFDDIPLVRFLDPPLTTVAVPMHDIGAAGVARMVQLLGDGERGQRVTVHPCHLVVRDSTAPPAETPTGGTQ